MFSLSSSPASFKDENSFLFRFPYLTLVIIITDHLTPRRTFLLHSQIIVFQTFLLSFIGEMLNICLQRKKLESFEDSFRLERANQFLNG